ncbi:hypothetical protein EXIGLDRAFT_643804 [Exidia glandulosa HHB12029]|uniref:Malate dehydrogenase n=1 Tax=Exidia glandulosa HHB12029 TaxID=1314781 RepID=A0A165K644_EXIGL|nr:hypothetical protein EXIGLDRAFT_643804 [Exidia glandulosa HHB12029]
MLPTLAATVLFVVVSAALPAARISGCGVSSIVPQIPAGQTNVTFPPNAVPAYITIGVGTQNYTCSDAGTYVYSGALATLYDISCIANGPTPILSIVEYALFKGLTSTFSHDLVEKLLMSSMLKLGEHYFLRNADASISPVFDFTNVLNDTQKFVRARRTGGLTAPDGKRNIDWLQLEKVDGELADTVLRIYTRAGQPPSTCTQGTPEITVPYASQYWFLRSNATDM